MSATNRGSDRQPEDTYPTPRWVVERALGAIQLPGGNWLDPCAGEGAILRAVEGVNWWACEIRPECARWLCALTDKTQVLMGNYLETQLRGKVDVIFTNPPYSLAREFVDKALGEAEHVVMLLRINFLGSEERAAWWKERSADIYVLPNRPSFTRSKKTGKWATDATEYAWFHWNAETMARGYSRTYILDLTDKEIRAADRPETEAA